MTTDEIIAEYPYLEEDDIRAAIAFDHEIENKEWTNLTARQFLAGYSDSDAIYDKHYRLGNECVSFNVAEESLPPRWGKVRMGVK